MKTYLVYLVVSIVIVILNIKPEQFVSVSLLYTHIQWENNAGCFLFFLFVVAMSDLVHDVVPIFHLS